MKILVYGAGNIGSLYAAKLTEAGETVSLLARGDRLERLRAEGLTLEAGPGGDRRTIPLDVVERLAPDDAYDLVLVVLPQHHIAEVLPTLAASRATPAVMFFGNNPIGPGAMVEALGRDRVLLGFPGAAAIEVEGALRYVITTAREQPTTIGELDGGRTPRLDAIEAALTRAGFPVEVSDHMDAWLKTHAAEIGPTAQALYLAGGDAAQLAERRDALVLMTRAIREGYDVLHALDIPVTPPAHRLFEWLPERLLVWVERRALTDDGAQVKIGHALHARAEMRSLADGMATLAAHADVKTPAMDQLRQASEEASAPAA